MPESTHKENSEKHVEHSHEHTEHSHEHSHEHHKSGFSSKLTSSGFLLTLIIVVFIISISNILLTINIYNTLKSGGGSQLQVAPTQQPSQAQQNAQGGTTLSTFAIPTYETPQGSSSAKVNVIEFGDYQCPFCQRHFLDTQPQIKQNYIDTGKIKFYFLDYSFLGPDSTPLGEGAWCADEQGKYWDYNAYMYTNQGQEGSGWASGNNIKTLAKNIAGLDATKFNTCLDSGKYATRVSQETSLGSQAGVTGTPGFLIGNDKVGYTVISGAYPYATFQSTIDAALAKA